MIVANCRKEITTIAVSIEPIIWSRANLIGFGTVVRTFFFLGSTRRWNLSVFRSLQGQWREQIGMHIRPWIHHASIGGINGGTIMNDYAHHALRERFHRSHFPQEIDTY
jgi:hypothetical protein